VPSPSCLRGLLTSSTSASSITEPSSKSAKSSASAKVVRVSFAAKRSKSSGDTPATRSSPRPERWVRSNRPRDQSGKASTARPQRAFPASATGGRAMRWDGQGERQRGHRRGARGRGGVSCCGASARAGWRRVRGARSRYAASAGPQDHVAAADCGCGVAGALRARGARHRPRWTARIWSWCSLWPSSWAGVFSTATLRCRPEHRRRRRRPRRPARVVGQLPELPGH
jgi:hypothetical protein